MISISNFFQKFLKLDNNNIVKLALISDIIKNETGIVFSSEKLKISGDRLNIECNPVFKNEIFMHKQKIEDSLKSQNIFLNIY